MKRAIFQRFILILSLALILSGSIFSIVISNIITNGTKEDMLYALKLVDHNLNYSKNLDSQIDNLKDIKGHMNTRYTIMDLEGDVLADNEVADDTKMANHKNRPEVKEALKNGTGSAKRRSDTLKIPMLYVAARSETGKYIIRIAVPFSGIGEYAGVLLPAILISILITLAVSAILAERFSISVTKPLNEIADEMLKFKDPKSELSFKKYQYDEINVISDTTIKMTKAIKESMKKIEFEKMVRQEFFSNASHELKTPLTSVRGYVELLENDMVANEDMKKEFLYRIKKETQNMTNLINDILMISRLETKEAEVVLTEVRICPLVSEVCNTLKPLADECEVSVSMNCRPITMYANTQQLRELFSNLITNAIKYNIPGGKVFVTVTSEAKEIIIIVEDTGVGIPEDATQRVFERFYRVDKGRSKKMGGTGLGLSIVKHIVNYYNGTIELKSKLSEGSKFTVRLPLNQTNNIQ